MISPLVISYCTYIVYKYVHVTCLLLNNDKTFSFREITDGVIAPIPEPAEERRVRSRHGSPRGVCAAVAWA